MNSPRKSHIGKFLLLLFTWQVGFLCYGYQLDNPSMDKQISMFVEEIQEEDDNASEDIPFSYIDDLDPEWENTFSKPMIAQTPISVFSPLQNKIPNLGFRKSLFSPPELIDNF